MELVSDSRSMIALMVTRKCNMTCAHCSVASSPSLDDGPSDGEVTAMVEEAIRAGVKMIQFTGGEPMLREKLILELMDLAKSNNVSSAMTSNGFWGAEPKEAGKKLKALRKAGLVLLTISYDPFHEKFMPIESVKNIAKAAQDQRFTLQINLTRLKDDRNLNEIADSLREFDSVQLRFYDVQPVGRAKKFSADTLRGSSEGFCNACERAAISEDGRVMACNGPAYFSKDDSALIVGSLKEESLSGILDRHAADPILQTIRTKGPQYLKSELAKLPEGKDFPFRENYNGICDLCLHVTSESTAMAALRQHLSSPREQTQRESIRLLIAKQRQYGEFNRNYINRGGITKILLDGSLPGDLLKTGQMRSHILSRSDLDWQEVLRSITSNGLARPLLPFFQRPDVKPHAPAFVQSGIQRAAIAESLKMVQVEAVLRTVSECLAAMKDTTAVLLKGGALVLQALSEGEPTPCKTPGDIDLYIAPDKAVELRDRLLNKGFEGLQEEAKSHHLPPVSLRNISVEIHVRIMPENWALPEGEMIGKTVPIPGWDSFSVLSIEGFLLHTLVHTASESYTHGLKTLWGNLYAMQRHGIDKIDWNLLHRWIKKSAAPRAFWVPLQIACKEVNFPVPAEFLAHAPADKRQDLLLRYARGRMFSVINHSDSGFILRKMPHDLLLTDSFSSRAKLVGYEFSIRAVLRRLQYIKRTGFKSYFHQKINLAIEFSRQGKRMIKFLLNRSG